MTNNAVLTLQDLQVSLQSDTGIFNPVDRVSLSVEEGKTFALLGESGCGKSMTALSIMRLLPLSARYSSGDVFLGEESLLELPEKSMRKIRGGRIGMIFQDPMTSLNPVLTVGFQIRESVELHTGLKGKMAKDKVVELLDDVGIPDPERRYSEYPHELSGGMKQRVMIAMALAGDPSLLIADEPTTALDVTIQAQILELLQKIQADRSMSMLLITHDLGVVAKVADHVGVMYAGEMVEQAEKNTFFSNPRHPYSKKLFESLPSIKKRGQRLKTIEGIVPSMDQEFLGCRFADRCNWVKDLCRTISPENRGLSDNGQVRCHLFDPSSKLDMEVSEINKKKGKESNAVVSSAYGEEILEVNGLKVHFPIKKGLFKRTMGQVKAVDGVSFSLKKGQTLALVGESGCGKTTAGKCILRLNERSAGSIRFSGNDLHLLGESKMRPFRSDIQIIFQDAYASMNPRMTIQKIIEEGMLSLRPEMGLLDRVKRIDELVEKVGLSENVKSRYPHELSGGQRQRVCIARALAVNPKLIVCDEPTSALDVSVQAQILNLLKDLQREYGLAYLFITHNLSAVEYLADDVAVMYLGRIVEYGPVQSVLDAPKHPYTQALISAILDVDPEKGREIIRLKGELPSPANPPKGCHFNPRCEYVTHECLASYPEKMSLGDNHWMKCFRRND